MGIFLNIIHELLPKISELLIDRHNKKRELNRENAIENWIPFKTIVENVIGGLGKDTLYLRTARGKDDLTKYYNGQQRTSLQIY